MLRFADPTRHPWLVLCGGAVLLLSNGLALAQLTVEAATVNLGSVIATAASIEVKSASDGDVVNLPTQSASYTVYPVAYTAAPASAEDWMLY